MPGRHLIYRLVALSAFLVAVAVGLWLLDLRPLVVVGVMVFAYAIAATIELLSWREERPRPAPGEEPRAERAAPPTSGELEPEPAGGLWLLRGEEPPKRDEEHEPVEAPSPPREEPPAPAEPEARPEPEPAPPPPSPPPAPLRPVPPPPPEPEPPPIVAAGPAPPQASVVDLRRRAGQPREWNLWDLERIAREESRRDPGRTEEWSYLFLHLRRFASADGILPTEFDGLVRESFAGLLDRAQGV